MYHLLYCIICSRKYIPIYFRFIKEVTDPRRRTSEGCISCHCSSPAGTHHDHNPGILCQRCQCNGRKHIFLHFKETVVQLKTLNQIKAKTTSTMRNTKRNPPDLWGGSVYRSWFIWIFVDLFPSLFSSSAF